MKSIATKIRTWFRREGWHVREGTLPEGDVIFLAGIAAETPAFKGYYLAVTGRKTHVESALYLPVKVQPEYYSAVAEYLMRVNVRYHRGRWTLDYSDGEVCFSVVKDREALEADIDAAMDDLVGYTSEVCDGFAAGVVQIVTGTKPPKQAYEEAVAHDVDASSDDGKPEDAAASIGGVSSKKNGRSRVKHAEDKGKTKVEQKHRKRNGI